MFCNAFSKFQDGGIVGGKNLKFTESASFLQNFIVIHRDLAVLDPRDKGTNNNTVDLSSETEITLEAIGSTITLTAAAGDIS